MSENSFWEALSMAATSLYPLTLLLAQAQGEVGASSQKEEDPERYYGVLVASPVCLFHLTVD